MAYRGMLIFVEGTSDKTFFEDIIKPVLERRYDNVKIVEYSQEKNKKISDYIKSIRSMNGEYILTADINNKPCITSKKEAIQNGVKNIDCDRIVLVIKEIESWYLAGLDKESREELNVSYNKLHTDELVKEQFERLMPCIFDSIIDFRVEMLKYFSIDTAKKQNKSFKYFADKYL